MSIGSYQFEKLEGRHQEAALLAERAQLRLDGFADLLRRHGLGFQDKVLELGCGQGIRTRLLAKNFPGTTITGLDRSGELLSQARGKDTPENLTFVEGNLYELPFSDKSFDFVYARLVFMHLNEPHKALQEIMRVLRPGGKVLIEDADRDCMYFEPAPASFADFWEKIQSAQRGHGGDPNMGRKLAPYLKAAKFSSVTIEVQPIVGAGDEIEFLVRTLLPSLNTYLAPIDRPQGEIAIQDLRDLAKNPTATFYHFWFAVSGSKEQ